MGTTTTIVKADTFAQATPKVRRVITGAVKALSALEPTPARLSAAVKAVGNIRALGYSVRGTVAILSDATNGNMPVGKGTIERLGYIADAIADASQWPALDRDATLAIVQDLYRIAQVGAKDDITRAAELGRKATDANGAIVAVAAVKAELNEAERKALTAPPARKPQTPDTKATEPSDEKAPAPAPRETQSALDGATTLALAQALLARVSRPEFTPDAVLTQVLEALTQAAEAAAEAEALATK